MLREHPMTIQDSGWNKRIWKTSLPFSSSYQKFLNTFWFYSWLHKCRCEAFFLIFEVLFECRCFPLLNQKRCTKVSSYLTQTQVLLPLVCFWERMLCSLFPKVCEKLSLLRRTRSCVCSLCPFFKTHLPLHVIARASSLLLLVALWGGWSLLCRHWAYVCRVLYSSTLLKTRHINCPSVWGITKAPSLLSSESA